MTVAKIATVLAVEDLAGAVTLWETLLGSAPTFVDPGRWAQFDTPGGRIALAAGAEAAAGSGVMVKVGDLAAARDRIVAAGVTASEIETGAHERRFAVRTAAGSATFYAPL